MAGDKTLRERALAAYERWCADGRELEAFARGAETRLRIAQAQVLFTAVGLGQLEITEIHRNELIAEVEGIRLFVSGWDLSAHVPCRCGRWREWASVRRLADLGAAIARAERRCEACQRAASDERKGG